jgi:hypothetical protein
MPKGGEASSTAGKSNVDVEPYNKPLEVQPCTLLDLQTCFIGRQDRNRRLFLSRASHPGYERTGNLR